MRPLLFSLALVIAFTQATEAQWWRWMFPKKPGEIAFTHFVVTTGSASSDCTLGIPCTLTRAFALAAGGIIDCQSIVNVSAGYYTQAELVYGPSQSCSSNTYVKFIGNDGAVVTGLEVKPSAASFTLTAGQTYTYETAWNEADSGKFIVGLAAQRDPSTWVPITIEDRPSPFLVESNTQFELDEPINYTQRSSIAEVEVHRCTFWNDTAANKVYVHMCHNGVPVVNDDLYFGRARWGNVIVQGDGLWWDNIDIRHVSLTLGVGFLVESTADHTVLRNSALLSAAAEIGGVNSLVEDMEFGYAITQGPSAAGCYDQDSNTTNTNARSCFNTNATGGALNVGIQGSTASSNQVVRRAVIHRSWNGASVSGANTLENSTSWGFPNHNLIASGTGVVIRNVVAANSQDSLYISNNAFDDLTLENNLFLHGNVIWISYDQDGGTPNENWIFRKNIAMNLIIEDLTFDSMTSSCNIWINNYLGGGSDWVSLDNPSYMGGAVYDYTSLAAFKAAYPTLETNSVELAMGKWTDGTQFTNFTNQRYPTFSFVPANSSAQAYNMHSSCGKQVGPTVTVPAVP